MSVWFLQKAAYVHMVSNLRTMLYLGDCIFSLIAGGDRSAICSFGFIVSSPSKLKDYFCYHDCDSGIE
jgi:hypothetical protein